MTTSLKALEGSRTMHRWRYRYDLPIFYLPGHRKEVATTKGMLDAWGWARRAQNRPPTLLDDLEKANVDPNDATGRTIPAWDPCAPATLDDRGQASPIDLDARQASAAPDASDTGGAH